MGWFEKQAGVSAGGGVWGGLKDGRVSLQEVVSVYAQDTHRSLDLPAPRTPNSSIGLAGFGIIGYLVFRFR